MNSFINDIFEKMGSETADLARYNKKVKTPNPTLPASLLTCMCVHKAYWPQQCPMSASWSTSHALLVAF